MSGKVGYPCIFTQPILANKVIGAKQLVAGTAGMPTSAQMPPAGMSGGDIKLVVDTEDDGDEHRHAGDQDEVKGTDAKVQDIAVTSLNVSITLLPIA